MGSFKPARGSGPLPALILLADSTNHGSFVRSVTRLTNAAKKAGLISGAQKGAVARMTQVLEDDGKKL